jgi:hypothetical protein
MSDRLADLAPDDASAAMGALDAAKAPVYELAYQEARRALDGQESALAAFRTRAGVVLSAAAIVTSFLGGQALDAHDFTPLAWAAIGAFAVLGLSTLCVLWPDDQWEFEAVPNQILGIYAERPDKLEVPMHVIHRDLAVSPEQVGSLVEASDRGLAAEGAVWALMVVVVQPAVKGRGAFCAVAIEGAVGPAAKHGAD